MATYRDHLPQLDGSLYLTDGGIETTLVFHEGVELPDFAAFHLLRTAEGWDALLRCYRPYVDVARRFGTGLVLESPTWRASRDWGSRLGYSPEELAANRRGVELLETLRGERPGGAPIVISGCIGLRADGYVPQDLMNAAEAEDYHAEQVAVLAATDADMVAALTLNYADEAVGVARAARRLGVPVAISFTVETDGALPTGQPLGDAVHQVDRETAAYPVYFMINCAHPAHFRHVLDPAAPWTRRLRGIRANASRKSHAELNESPTLDAGDPVELGAIYRRLLETLPHLNVLGGCCGTDQRHVAEIGAACAGLYPAHGAAAPAPPPPARG